MPCAWFTLDAEAPRSANRFNTAPMLIDVVVHTGHEIAAPPLWHRAMHLRQLTGHGSEAKCHEVKSASI